MKEPCPRSKFVELFRCGRVSSESQPCGEGGGFQGAHGESVLAPFYFLEKKCSLQCVGYDSVSREWVTSSPLLSCPPKPGEQRFHVAGAGGVLCLNVSGDSQKEKLVLCNPQTLKTLELPPLNFRRNPVLIHLLVNHLTYSFEVIVAGGSSEGSSKLTEVFDSKTWQWRRLGNIPGPEFCLNEYQTGVCINGTLYCIAFLEDGSGKGVSGKGLLALNIKDERWAPMPALPFSTSTEVTSNMQLLECDGDLYIFSERRDQGDVRVHHCIEKLQSVVLGTAISREWTNVVKCGTIRWGTSYVLEYTCVPHGEGKFCIFNNIEHKGVVHDTVHGVKVDLLPPPARHGEAHYFTSNPISFSFAPRSSTGSVGEDLEQGAELVENDTLIHFSQDTTGSNFTRLCDDMILKVLLKVSGTYEEYARMKGASKAVKNVLESDQFYLSLVNARNPEGSFTLLMFALKEGRLHCVAFDLTAKKWRRLPSFKWISSPTNAVLSDYLVAGGGGLLCVTVADPHNPGTFVVYNPLKNRPRRLPPSTFRLNPVLMHLLVSPETHSYKLIVAGNSLQDNPDTSRSTEVFDSSTGVWTVTGDVPRGPGDNIALVEHQTGVYAAGIVYCIAHWRSVPGVKVILAYDVERGEWSNRHPLLPYDLQQPGAFGPRYHIAQLVACDNEVYLFSEIGYFWDKRSCLDKLNPGAFAQEDNNRRQYWSNVWTKARPKDNDSGKLVCVPHAPGKVCIFNKTQFTGVVYDILEDPAPQIPATTGLFFPGGSSFSLHTFISIFEPSFESRP